MVINVFEDMFDLVDEFKAETIDELTEEYEEIQEELLFWLTIFSVDGKLDWVEMKRNLTASQLKKLKRYIGDEIEERVRVKRIDAINLLLENKLREINDIFSEKLQDFSEKVYKETYYRVTYELQKENNLYWIISALMLSNTLTNVLKPWTPDAINFVRRIRINSDKLLNTLRKTITEEILAGEKPEVIKELVAKKVGAAVSATKAIINTELTRILSVAAYESMRDAGVKYYQLQAVIDDRTSKICLSMDGKVFPLSDFEIGVTASPFHNHCRTIEVPYGEIEHDGVSDNISSYGDWLSKYVQ